MDWNLWIKNLLNYDVVNKYKQLIHDNDRNLKTESFDSLYIDEFMKINVKHIFMLESTNAFQLQVIDKIKFLALIKPILSTKLRVSNKKTNAT